MGRESAHWILELSEAECGAVEAQLEERGSSVRRRWRPARTSSCATRTASGSTCASTGSPARRLEVRVALTNDTWAIRAPLERALTPLEPLLGGRPLRDEDGTEVATFGADGWSLALEDDYARLRDAFIARVGDFNAPMSTDHVYMYVHQTRWNRDNDDELAWHREREIARIESLVGRGGRPRAGALTSADSHGWTVVSRRPLREMTVSMPPGRPVGCRRLSPMEVLEMAAARMRTTGCGIAAALLLTAMLLAAPGVARAGTASGRGRSSTVPTRSARPLRPCGSSDPAVSSRS